MRTDVKAYRVTLRKDAIEKAIKEAAIYDEGLSESDIQAYWIEGNMPYELVVTLVPKPQEKST